MGSIFKNGNQSFRRSGFTIVELLIVIAIIGVLASISFAAYSGLKERAQASAVSMALNQAAKKIDLYHIENSTYPSSLSNVGINDDEVVYQYNVTSTAYCITGTQGSTSFYVSESVSRPTKGGCAGHGQGGVAAVTNLAINPSLESNASSWFPNYGASGAGTAIRMSNGGKSGASYFRVTWTTGGSSVWGGANVSPIGVAAGSTYSSSVWVRSSKARSMKMYMRTNNYPTIPDVTTSPVVNVSPNVWTELSGVYVAPSGATSFRPMIEQTVSGAWQAGDIIDFDALIFTEGSLPVNFADGSSPNWVWNGTPHASSSTGPAL